MATNNVQTMRGKDYFEYLKRHYQKKEVIEHFDDFLKFSNTCNRLVLDCGCGIGYLSRRLELHGNEVIGMDINLHMLCYAKKKLRLGNPMLGSVYNIPIRGGSLDAIYFIDVAEHLKKPLRALKELYRVLKSDGELFLITPNGLYRKVMGNMIKDWGDPTHIHEFTWNELRELIWKSGFKVITGRAAGIPLINKLHFKVSRKIAVLAHTVFLPLASPSFWAKIRKG